MADTALQHSPAPAPPDTPELIDKARAAKILGHRGTRRVLQLATDGKLEGVRQRVDGSTQVKVMFRLEDVRRYKAERDKPKAIDVTQAPAVREQDAGRPLVKLSPDVRDFVYLLNAVNNGRAPQPQKPFLDLKAAAEYTGLSARLLLILKGRGVLHPLEEPAEKGRKYARGERLRFSVADLDELRG